MRLTLHLLGPPEIHLDDEPASGFVSDKARALLFYLAVETDRAFRRETLAGLLWPDYPERSARTNLSNALSNLRTVLADRGANLVGANQVADKIRQPYLLVTRETIQFNGQSDHWLDVAAFDECVEHAQVEGRQWEEASALYRGSFLEGFSLADSPPFEGWALVTRERLQRQMGSALEGWAAACEETGDYAGAQDAARRLLELEPWHEGAHRALIRCLALSGDRASALTQYEACARALEDELGVEPAPETTRLVEQIRGGSLAPKEAQTRVQVEPDQPRHNLPAQLTSFVGREAELARIQACLADPACRLLTLVGPGGSGKTRLAIEAASGQVEVRPDGVFFVPLAPLQSPELMVPAIAGALGFTFYEGRAMREQLLDYLRGKHLLLVLDNVEHLLDLASEDRPDLPPATDSARFQTSASAGERGGAALLVTDILQTAPQVQIVATSRARLNARGEHLFTVEGMDLPGDQDVETYSAIQLYLQGARQVQPDFVLAEDNREDVARICRLVEGMPLAILLAAAWMRVLSPGEVVDELTRGLDLLASDARDLPRRQRSVRAVFDYSWNLLGGQEREVFAALSVFRGGFTRAAARDVSGALLLELTALIDQSLVHRVSQDRPGGGARFEAHELLRQYAAEKLEGEGRSAEVHDAHSAHYAQALQQWAADLKGARQQAALAEMDLELDNARAAWEWALEQGHVDRLAQGLDGLCTYYEVRGRYQEGADACQRVTERLADLEEGLQLRIRARVWESAFCRTLGDAEGAERLQEEAWSLLQGRVLQDAGTAPERAFLLLEQGRLAHHRGDNTSASRCYTESQDLYRSAGDTWGVAQALSALGQVVHNDSEYDSAEGILQESLALQRSLGDRRRMARTPIELGTTNIDRGRPGEAEPLARQATSIRREIGDLSGAATGLFVIAATHMGHGQFAKACSIFEENIAIQRRLGNRVQQAWGHSILAWAQCNLGRYDRARASEEDALTIWQETGHRAGEAMGLLGLGDIALAEGQFEAARDWLTRSLNQWREVGNRREIASSLAYLGLAERGLGRPALAWQHLEEALRTLAEIGSRPPTLSSLSGIAVLLADEGDVERAAELYATVTRYPNMRASLYYEDVAGRYVAAAAAALPAEVVEAARARGRARELDDVIAEALAACEAH